MVEVAEVPLKELGKRGLECKKLDRHAQMKRNPVAWNLGTTPIGEMPDGEGGVLEGANCKHCCSTIWRKQVRQ